MTRTHQYYSSYCMDKKIIIIIACLLTYLAGSAQNKHQIYSFDSNQRIIPVEGMMNPIGYESIEINGYYPSQFVSVGNSRYEIKVASAKYEDENTGFNIIEIHKGTEKLLELRDLVFIGYWCSS